VKINIRKRGTRWQVDFWWTHPETGERSRFRRTSPFGTKRQSRQWATRQYLELTDPASYQEPAPLYEDFVREYLDVHVDQLAPNTQRVQEGVLLRVYGEAFDGLRLDEIGAREIERHAAQRLQEVQPSTIRSQGTVLMSMLHKAKRWGLLERVPRVDWPAVEATEPRHLDDDELGRLIEASQAERLWRGVVEWMAETGCRPGEMRGLCWEHLDLARGEWRICEQITEGDRRAPKGGKTRRIPLTRRAQQLLADQRAVSYLGGGPVWVDPHTGERAAWMAYRRAWDRMCLAAEVADATPHTLRHTFASRLLRAGQSLSMVQELLGHSSITTTEMYAHLVQEDLARAVSALDRYETGTDEETG
jgi:integrase